METPQTQFSSSSMSPEGLVTLADKIYKEVGAVKTKAKISDEALLEKIRNENKDFAHSFPMVLRWMVQMGEYDSDAFRKYLKKIRVPFWETREAFLESQADYICLVYKAKNPRSAGKNLAKYRASIIENLNEEDKTFKKAYEEAAELSKEHDKKMDDMRRDRLYAYLMQKNL